ncbi:DUF302 domain-containing protein [Alicyclobacillus sp. ALC3]|uniref:DUF302 domain-containing protein n=1 Tax=Alicyclobacillus sp. ALC3 TaxID=2796143 RepID=UPI002379C727|nr:DUF302 domain-containing protein [Alicyclobacillus sp. ALC3]WDL96585.1 DUF302 domain-containing protein [Alicyclobacillus sp. ALC3]
MFHYTVETKKTLDEAVQSLAESLKTHNFGILWDLDIPSTLQSKGVDFSQPYRVLEVCNPSKAKEVLGQNSLVGYFLPCKIVAYEDHGTVKMGFPKPSMLMEVIQDPSLKAVAEEVEQTLMAAVKEAM